MYTIIHKPFIILHTWHSNDPSFGWSTLHSMGQDPKTRVTWGLGIHIYIYIYMCTSLNSLFDTLCMCIYIYTRMTIHECVYVYIYTNIYTVYDLYTSFCVCRYLRGSVRSSMAPSSWESKSSPATQRWR